MYLVFINFIGCEGSIMEENKEISFYGFKLDKIIIAQLLIVFIFTYSFLCSYNHYYGYWIEDSGSFSVNVDRKRIIIYSDKQPIEFKYKKKDRMLFLTFNSEIERNMGDSTLYIDKSKSSRQMYLTLHIKNYYSGTVTLTKVKGNSSVMPRRFFYILLFACGLYLEMQKKPKRKSVNSINE